MRGWSDILLGLCSSAQLQYQPRQKGRKPDDKELETIHIDIDLLAYGDTIFKPMDFARYTDDIAALQASI